MCQTNLPLGEDCGDTLSLIGTCQTIPGRLLSLQGTASFHVVFVVPLCRDPLRPPGLPQTSIGGQETPPAVSQQDTCRASLCCCIMEKHSQGKVVLSWRCLLSLVATIKGAVWPALQKLCRQRWTVRRTDGSSSFTAVHCTATSMSLPRRL